MPQDGAPPTSVDVLAAQVRAGLGKGLVAWSALDEASAALDALVARAKEAEERAEAHLMLRKEAASWAEEVELERDALVARVTEAERPALPHQPLSELHPPADRCIERVWEALPAADPSSAADPRTSLSTLAAILHAKLMTDRRKQRMSTCESCVHWRLDDQPGSIGEPYDPDTFEPMAMPFEVRRCRHPKLLFCERPLERNGFAVADGSTYFAAFYTGPDFGCVRHEQRLRSE